MKLNCRDQDASLYRPAGHPAPVRSPLSPADPLEFLAGCGFPVTKRANGLFDLRHAFDGLTAEGVLEVFHRLWFWPEWPSPPHEGERIGPPAPSRLCGGTNKDYGRPSWY
jgi:hypothetical protein